MPLKKRKANPGAPLAIDEIFGRDDFIAKLWGILEKSSVRMEAERRIGKSNILRKMAAEAPANWEVVSLDLEEVHSAAEFAEKVCANVHERLTGWGKQGRRFLAYLGFLGGTQIGPVKFPERKDRKEGYWKTLLSSAIEDLVEQQVAVGKRVVFFFDELPWMISAIADPKREGEQTAMELLDVLRSLRQSATTGLGFRMILCGSIGLHHVFRDLKRGGYKNQPVNDMRLVEVQPLERSLAVELTGLLLDGENLESDPEVLALIAEQTGGFPYYIHWVVSEMAVRGGAVNCDRVRGVIKTLLTDPQDPCSLRHFRERIDDYYPSQAKIALALIDHVAASSVPLSQMELINVGKASGAPDDDAVRELLRLLSVDHYIDRDVDGHYVFRHVLLRNWWIIERGLNV